MKAYLTLPAFAISAFFPALTMAETILISEDTTAPARFSLESAARSYVIADSATLTFSGFTSTDNAGAISLNGASASLSASPLATSGKIVFSNNSAVENGGAIYNGSGASLGLTNARFNNNSAKRGGAIHTTQTSPLTLTASSFTGNSASWYGGAIYSTRALDLSGLSFTGNHSGEYGGAIYSTNAVTVANSTLSNNRSERGGAIYATTHAITLNNTQASGNHATRTGGVIYSGGNVFLNNATVSGNSAAMSAGAIYTTGNVTLKNTVLTNNSAGGNGGGIFLGNARTLTVSTTSGKHLVSHGNQAGSQGGFVYSNNTGSSVVFDLAENSSYTLGQKVSGSQTPATDTIAGVGSISKRGAGELVFNTVQNQHNGDFRVEQGTLSLNAANALANASIILEGDSVIDIKGNDQIFRALSINNGGGNINSVGEAALQVGTAATTYNWNDILSFNDVTTLNIPLVESPDYYRTNIRFLGNTDSLFERIFVNGTLARLGKDGYVYSTDLPPIPEPATWAALVGMAAGFASIIRRRKQRNR